MDKILDIIKNAKDKNLTALDLSNNQLTSIPKEINELKCLTELNLQSNQLTSLPKELYELTNLKKLNISYNQISFIPHDIIKLNHLKELDLLGNQLTSLPKEFVKLKDLTFLDLTFNPIRRFPIEILELEPLETLNLSATLLTKLPTEICRLSNLLSLNVGSNPNVILPKKITKLEKLEFLGLYGNQLTILQKEIFELKNLEYLFVFSNQLTIIPKAISKLKNLKRLVISDNLIKDLPKELFELKHLERLIIDKNQLTSLPKEIGKLKNLTDLSVGRNQLTSIPNELSQLKYLKILDLRENQLISLSGEISTLENLEVLWLGNNQLTSLPKEITELKKLRGLFLSDNPIVNIPKEIYSKKEDCAKDVIDYFKGLKKQTVPNNEIKLIFLGNTTAGKTSLFKYLKERIYVPSQPSTHGIEITQWEVKGDNSLILANVWDFGGQEYYHATHKLFLSSNSLYILVWEKNTNTNGLLETDINIGNSNEKIKLEHYHYLYWLNNIRYYTSNAPIVMVQNKVDDLKNKEDLEEGCYDENKIFKVLKPCHAVSVKNAFGYSSNEKSDKKTYYNNFENFEIELIKYLHDFTPKYPLPAYWVEIRDGIRARKDEYIWEYHYYKRFCYEIDPDIEFDTLTGFLCDTGVILYFGKNTKEGSKLKDLVFINPKFITDIIYKILDYSVIENNGCFNIGHAEQNVNTYLQEIGQTTNSPPNFAKTIIDLMQANKFELVFKHPTLENHFIAPQYLPDNINDNADFTNIVYRLKDISFVMFYPHFLPKSVINRLIVRFGNRAKFFFKYGIFIENGSKQTYIYCDFKARKIYLKNNQLSSDKLLIKDIFKALHDINDNNENIELSLNDIDYVPIKKIIDNSRFSINEFIYNEKLFKTKEFALLNDLFDIREEEHKNYYGPQIIKNMKIYNSNFWGPVIERLEKLEYNPQFNINQGDFNDFKNGVVKQFSSEDKIKFGEGIEELKKAESPEKKESIAKRVGEIFESYGIGVASKITADIISNIFRGI